MRLPRAFTLIELLIVVVIIAILAVVAMPNFLEAQTRAKVSATLNDQRVLVNALAVYGIDNTGQYPPTQAPVLASSQNSLLSSRTVDFRSFMTTPVAYLTEIPLDDQFKGGRHVLTDATLDPVRYVYRNYHSEVAVNMATNRSPDTGGGRWAPQHHWEIVSVGPDLVSNLLPVPLNSLGYGHENTYDPTNGTVSYGDIYRTAAVRSHQ